MEKAVLLTSLLKNAGIKTEMIAVSKPYFDVNDKIGMLFDNFVVKAYYGNNDEIYLSPVHTNDNNMIYDLQGDLYYPINNDAKISTLPKGDYSNQIQIKGTFNLSTDNSLTGNAEVKVTDKFNKYLKYLLNPEAAKGLIANANEAKLLSSDKNSSVINLTIENKKAYKKLKNYMFFDLPEATNGINTWGLEQQIEKREAPLELQSNIDESYEYEIVMPEGFKLATGNFNQNIKNNAGFVKISIEQKGNSLIVKKEIRINNKVIEVKDYVDFRKLVNTWRNKQYRELIINN
jgi:hypothetical protein